MKSVVLPAVLVCLIALYPQVARSGWQGFTTSDGLGGNNIGQVLEDRSGNIWAVGTSLDSYPVSRYDGWRWTTFPVMSERVFEDSQGHIWAATITGAARFDGTRWQEFGRPDRRVYYARAILENRPGSIWFASSEGIGHYDETGWTQFYRGEDLPDGAVQFMVSDTAGDIYACGYLRTGSAWVIRYKDGEWSTIATVDGPLEIGFSAMHADRTGNVWVLGGGGIDRWNGQAWDYPLTYSFFTSFGLDPTTVFEDVDGTLWIGTRREGIQLYRDGVFTRVAALAGLNIPQIFRARSGATWVAWIGQAGRSGISRYDSRGWQTVATVDSLPFPRQIGNIMEDHSGRIWFNAGDAVYVYDGFLLQKYSRSDGYRGGIPNCGLVDRSGSVWVGSGGGLSRGDGAGFSTVAKPEALRGIQASLRDRSGNLWFGTNGQGLFRFDGNVWKQYDTSNFLVGQNVYPLLEDRHGDIWAGVRREGSLPVRVLQRFNGAGWTTYGSDNLPGSLESMIEADDGSLWIGSSGGLVRYDGSAFTRITTADGAPADTLIPTLKERSGALWFLYTGGLARFDGSGWRDFPAGNAVPSPLFGRMIEDASGNIWVGVHRPPPTEGWKVAVAGEAADTLYDFGACRFDGTSWTVYQVDGEMTAVDRAGGVWCGNNRFDGTDWTSFPYLFSWQVAQDSQGNVWFASNDGVFRFDGASSTRYGPDLSWTFPIVDDRLGGVWFVKNSPLSLLRYSPDRVASRSIILSRPPLLTAATEASALFVPGYGETDGVEFSTRFDDGPWSSWSPVGAWSASGLSTGVHTLNVRSHDAEWNIEPATADIRFEVDATPPAPVLQSPAFGSAVRGIVQITGMARDLRFLRYRVETRRAGAGSWDPPAGSVIAESSRPSDGDTLAIWDTSNLPDGAYDLRLSVADTLGVTGTVQVTVTVDNVAPFADRTTPALVTAAGGGDVYTPGAEFHVYVPPHGFSRDAVVTIEPLPDALPADPPRDGATWTGTGWTAAWDVSLEKAATIDITIPEAGSSDAGAAGLAIYRSVNGGEWERLGGTPDASGRRIATTVTEAGSYAVFRESGPVPGARTLTGLAFTPRVFSPRGTYADRQVAISFDLGTAAPVTVKIYDTTGRLVRELMSAEVMGAGTNLVRWDGHDLNEVVVADGLYLVTVEAFGDVRKKTLAVVR